MTRIRFLAVVCAAYFFVVCTQASAQNVVTSSVTPATTPVNNPSANITISGSNFSSGATVLFTPPGGPQAQITPSMVQAAQIAATIPATLLSTSGTAQIAVMNATGGASSTLSFTISPLTISAVSPNSAPPGSAGTSITVAGQYFNSAAQVIWTTPGGATVQIQPSLIQSAQLAATIPSSLFSTAGTAQIAISDPNSTLSNSLSFVISTGALTISGSGTLPEIGLGTAVSSAYTISGGKAPYTLSAAGLPGGLTLNSTSGALTGVPATPGNYSFTISASDSSSPPATTTLPVTLKVLGITTSASLPNAAATKPYSQVFAAAGGSGTYTFSSPNAPAGLAFSGSTLTGSPTSGGTFIFQVTVADGTGVTASSSFKLVIAPGTLSVTSSGNLGEIALGSGVSAALSAVGGEQPFNWSSANLPPGVTLNPSSGALGGSPSQPGNYSFTVQVADSQTTPATANLALVLQVLGLTTPGTLPAGSAGTAYSETFSAAGGSSPYRFSSPNAPAGLSFSGATLSGTPAKVGTYSFTVTATDATGFAASSQFSLIVNGAESPLTVSGGALTSGKDAISYSQTLTGSGGQPPYTWALIGGALPRGLSLDGPSGTISGTPSLGGATSTFTAQATDAAKATASGVFTITIAAEPLSVTGLPFPNGIVGSAYPLQVVSAAGGQPPYTVTVSSGSLPPGLTLSSGQLSGTPTASGTFGFSIMLTDSGAPSQTITTPIQLVISPAGVTNLLLGSASLSFQLTAPAVGLPAPYSVTVQSSAVQQQLSYSVVPTPAVPWLDVNGGGTTPGSIGIALDPGALNLAASSMPLTTSIVVTCLAPSPCEGMAQTIAVSLAVSAPSPQLTFLATLAQFRAVAGVTTPLSQQVGIQNVGGGSAVITSAFAADSWLTVSGVPASVASGPPVNITLTANPAGLGPGFFYTTVTIISSGGTTILPVALEIPQAPSLTLSLNGTQFQSTLGSAPGNTNGSFQVGLTGSTSVAFTAAVQPGASWLVLNPASAAGTASGANPATLSYSINPAAAAALSPAQAYYGTIVVNASGVANSPQVFEVVLNVASAATLPAPDPEPAGLLFRMVSGSTVPPAQISIYSSSVSRTPYAASTFTAAGGSWLSVSPTVGASSASSPGTGTVTVTPGTMGPGVYTGTVSYQFSAAAVRSVNVTLIIEAPGGVTGNSTGLAPGVTSGATSGVTSGATSGARPDTSATCTPTRLVPTHTGLVTNFTQPTSWPTPLSVLVVDNCGAPVADGQVVVNFSNNDPPLALSLVNGNTGLYSGTWIPANTSGQVTVLATVTANGFTATTSITGGVVANTAPMLAPGGALHIYNPLVGAPIGQGTILQIYGSGLGASPAVATSLPLTTTINGTSVSVGGIPAALYFVSSGQIDAQLPLELTPGNSYPVVVNANGQLSTATTIQVTAATPGIAAFATGQIVAQHGDFSLVSETSPAVPGEFLVMYLSGMGLTGVTVEDGAPSPDPSNLLLLSPVAVPTLTLNSTSIPIYFSGLSPGYVGLYQMNFQVPPGTPNGDMLLTVSQAGKTSNSVILPVHN